VKFHSEALKLSDGEGSALVGTEFVGWLAPNCQGEMSIPVLPDNSGRGSVTKRADAALAEGRIHVIDSRNAC
jgi:hypothetical protein